MVNGWGDSVTRVHGLDSKGDGSGTTTTKVVVPTLKTLTNSQMRVAVKVIFAFVFISSASLSVLIVLQRTDNLDKTVGQMKGYALANLIIASIGCVGLLGVLVRFLWKVWVVWRSDSYWPKKYKVMTTLGGLGLLNQTINCIVYLLPNLLATIDIDLVSGRNFAPFGIVRFTTWNTKFFIFVLNSRLVTPWDNPKKNHKDHHPGATLLVSPWYYHCYFALWWLLMEGAILGTAWESIKLDAPIRVVVERGLCRAKAILQTYVGLLNGIIILYQVTNIVVIFISYQSLRKRPYVLFRDMNILVRYNFMYALFLMDVILFSFVWLYWMEQDGCGGIYMSLFGILPAQIVAIAWSIVSGIIGAPTEEVHDNTIGLSMPCLAWKESDIERAGQNAGESSGSAETFPDFCFETAVKLWYWSFAAYSYKHEGEKFHDPTYPEMKKELALKMFDFEDCEYWHIPETDMHLLLGRSQSSILVSFRGTNSAANLRTDMTAARVIHPPERGSYTMQTKPLIHRGWMSAWKKQGLNHKLLNWVISTVLGDGFDRSNGRLFVTGHSLGGALAVTAAFDMARYSGLRRDQITCYTFGAPRVGNHAFAREYNSWVPDTWQVVNDHDVIPRIPKFLFCYKHAGQRAIMNASGDLIVRPTVVEVSFYHVFRCCSRDSANSLGQHSLLSYRKSFVAICEAQCVNNKAMNDGKRAIPELLSQRGSMLSMALGISARSLHLSESFRYTASKDLDEPYGSPYHLGSIDELGGS